MQPTQISESDSNALVFDSYVMHVNCNVCNGCGTEEIWSKLWEVWVHPTKVRTTGMRKLCEPTGPNDQSKRLAIIKVPRKFVPICSECVVARRGKDDIAPISNEAWADTLKRKYAPAASEVKVAKPTAPAKVVPTLDQI